MRLAPAWVAALCLALLATVAVGEVSVYQCRYRPAREAAAVAEPLLSAEGSLEIQPRLNTIVVRDRPEVLQRVAAALARWDAAPASFRVRIRLIMASTAPPPRGQPRPRLEGLGSELTGLFNFGSYQEIDTVEVSAADGSLMETSAGTVYRVRMRLRGVEGDPTRLQLAPFELARREGPGQGMIHRSILKSTVSLQVGQTGILVATRSEEAKQALIVILAADREPTR